MSSIIQSPSEESVEQQNSTRRRSLFPIKHLLAHLDIDLSDDDHEATNLTNLMKDFLSVTKHFTNAEICELSDAALEQYAAEFLGARSTFGESGNATMGDKFWPTGHYEKKLTYAKHPTMIKDNVKLIMVNQRENKRVTFAKKAKKRQYESAEEETPVPGGSTSSGGSTPVEAVRSSNIVEHGGCLPYSATANIPIILECSSPASASQIKRSVTPDGLLSPISFRSPSPNFVDEISGQQNSPKRRRHDPAETAKCKDTAKGTAGVAGGYMASTGEHSTAWDAGVFAVQLQIERYQAEIQKGGAEAETGGNSRKKMNCDHISDALQELLSRVCAEKKKKEEKMKASPYSWFSPVSTHRRASSASGLHLD